MKTVKPFHQSLLLFFLVYHYFSFKTTTVSSYSLNTHERTRVILYHKPTNIVTTHAVDDVLGRLNVFQDIYTREGYVSSRNEKDPILPEIDVSSLHAVGRLDAETTGLLLLTNDGGLVHHVTNKKAASHVNSIEEPISKTYEALIMGHHTRNSNVLQPLYTTGVDIGVKYGGLCNPVQQFTILNHPSPKTTLVSLTLREGKNRQVRRMFHAVGSGVMKLTRTKIGTKLTFDCIEEPGQWRFLSEEEIFSCLHWESRFWMKPVVKGGDTRRRRRLTK